MPAEQIVGLGQAVLKEVTLLATPILGIALIVSLLVNLVQVLTSLQEITITSVPRLLASAGALFFLLPWMLRHLNSFTIHMLTDFHQYLR